MGRVLCSSLDHFFRIFLVCLICSSLFFLLSQFSTEVCPPNSKASTTIMWLRTSRPSPAGGTTTSLSTLDGNPSQNFATPGRRPGLSRRATLNKRAESWSSSLRCARGSRKENRKTMDPTMKEVGLVVLPRRDGERWTASLPANGEYANLTRIYDSRGMHQSVLQDVILSLPYPCDEKFHLPLTRYFGGRCACPC